MTLLSIRRRAAVLAVAWAALSLPLGSSHAEEAADACVECQVRQRKIFEAMQAWRRTRGGEYPLLQKDLEEAGLIDRGGAVCPAMARELDGGSSRHDLTTARGQDGDSPASYEYEMANEPLPVSKELFLDGERPTWRDLKTKLLQQPFWEQVPILRCSAHRMAAPPGIAPSKAFRNFTAEGRVYWSESLWEHVWSEDVPSIARSGLVLSPECGPPFHSGAAPPEDALDLRPWVNASAKVPWWWGSLTFFRKSRAPDLRPLLPLGSTRILEAGGSRFWLDGLVQLQGGPWHGSEGEEGWSYAEAKIYPFERRGLKVDRALKRATWLQGTAWSAQQSDLKVATLVWRYADGTACEVPVMYVKDVWRFAADVAFYEGKKRELPVPAWSEVEVIAPGQPLGTYQISLWKQTWENPRPEVPVATLDLIGNRNCSAGLFIAAISVE